jgi:hypothetical protein
MAHPIIKDSLVEQINEPSRQAIRKIVAGDFGEGVLLKELSARFNAVPVAEVTLDTSERDGLKKAYAAHAYRPDPKLRAFIPG